MIDYLSWDSEFFRKKIYSVNIDSSSQALKLSDVIKELKNLDADGAYIILHQSNKWFEDELKEYNIPLMDEKITYEKVLSPSTQIVQPNAIITPFIGPVTNSLKDLSLEAGKFSRFKADEELSDQFEELYKLWIEKSVAGAIADFVFTYTEGGLEKGMVTFKIKDNIGTIGLIGVDQHLQGRGIGTQLIMAVEKYYINNNVFISRVATQATNKLACRFYSKRGYTIHSIQPIYHIWFKKFYEL